MDQLYVKPYWVFEAFGRSYVFRVRTLFSERISAEDSRWLLGLHSGELPDTEENRERLERLHLLSEKPVREPYLENDGYLLRRDIMHMRLRCLELMVAQGCNMHCEYCYGDEGKYGAPGMMTQETAFKGIDFLYECQNHECQSRECRNPSSGEKRLPVITFFGGEPLLNYPLIASCIDYAEGKFGREGIRFGITTNLTLLTDEMVEKFAEHSIRLNVSFDGVPELQRSRRILNDGRDSYDVLLAQLEKARKKLPGLSVRATVYSRDDRRRTEEAIRKLGIRRYQLFPVSGCLTEGTKRKDVFEVQQEETDAWKRRTEAFLKAVGERDASGAENAADENGYRTWLKEVLLFRPPERVISGCSAGRQMAALSADGRFYPCHRFTGSEAHAMGDIDGRFPDRKMFASHIALENPKCRSCPARYACGAPCPYISACDAEEEEGVRPEFRAPETYCRLMKMKLMMRAVLADRLSGEDRRWIAGAVFRAEDA